MTIEKGTYKNFNKYNFRVRKIVGRKIPRLNSKCNNGLRLCGINKKYRKTIQIW
jgi:hypothetical protein